VIITSATGLYDRSINVGDDIEAPKPINAKAALAAGSWTRLSVHGRQATTRTAKTDTPTMRSIRTK